MPACSVHNHRPCGERYSNQVLVAFAIDSGSQSGAFLQYDPGHPFFKTDFRLPAKLVGHFCYVGPGAAGLARALWNINLFAAQ